LTSPAHISTHRCPSFTSPLGQAYLNILGKPTPQFKRLIAEKTLLVGLGSTVFRDAVYTSHEVFIDDEQVRARETMHREGTRRGHRILTSLLPSVALSLTLPSTPCRCRGVVCARRSPGSSRRSTTTPRRTAGRSSSSRTPPPWARASVCSRCRVLFTTPSFYLTLPPVPSGPRATPHTPLTLYFPL
jgi:hypothetical protein